MNAKQIIRLTCVDPTDPFTREVHTGQLRMERKDSYELEDGRVLHKNVEDRDVSVEIQGYTAPLRGTMVVSWVGDDKDEYFGVYAFGSDSYRGYNRRGDYGVLSIDDGLVDCPWKVVA